MRNRRWQTIRQQTWVSASFCVMTMHVCTATSPMSVILPQSNHQITATTNINVYLLANLIHTVVHKNWTPTIFSNNVNKYWSMSIMFGRQNEQSVQCLHVWLENFDQTWYQLKSIPYQPYYTVCQKTGPLHYCNKILQQIMKCSAIQCENVNKGHAVTITHTHTCTHPRFTALWTLSGTTRVSQYQNQSGFYWSQAQWVAVASA